MTTHEGGPEEQTITDQFGSFLSESLSASTQLRQEHIVETELVRRLDFAQAVPYVAPAPGAPKVDTSPALRMVARLEQDLQQNAKPTLQVVVIENNGLSASRIRFEDSPAGYVRSESVMVRKGSGSKPKTRATTERTPTPITEDDFMFVVESLFSAQPTKLTEPDAEYFLSSTARDSWLARNVLRRHSR